MIDWVRIKKDGRTVGKAVSFFFLLGLQFVLAFVIATLLFVGAAFNIDSGFFGDGLPSGFALYIPLWFFRVVVVVVGLWFSHRLFDSIIERYTK